MNTRSDYIAQQGLAEGARNKTAPTVAMVRHYQDSEVALGLAILIHAGLAATIIVSWSCALAELVA